MVTRVVRVSQRAGLTVDELAQQVGMTVRNVRAHQSRGLLPPPDVRGRTGFYGPEHVARLQLIQQMQAEGFNLRAVAHTLERLPPGGAAEVLAFRHDAVETWVGEAPEVFTAAELADLIGTDDRSLLTRACELGVLRDLGDDRFEALSPSLIRAAEAMVALGVPIEEVLRIQTMLCSHAEGVAAEYVELFIGHVWRRFVAAGQPESQWPKVREALARMQPLASQALVASFRLAMQEASEQALQQEMTRSAGEVADVATA